MKEQLTAMRGKLDRARGVSLSGFDDDPRVAEIMNGLLRARLVAHQMLAEERRPEFRTVTKGAGRMICANGCETDPGNVRRL